MTSTTTTRSTPDLPVPREALIELGLTEEQIDDAIRRAPLVLSCQAHQHPGAWFDVERASKMLRAMGQFKHTKGRWAGTRLRLGEGLDPWQVVWILAPVFGWVYLDPEIDTVVRVIRAAWVEVPRKAGKMLRPSTPIRTPRGWSTMGELAAGDEVYAPDGSRTRVTWASAPLEQHSHTVRFADGAELVAGPDHEWVVNDRLLARRRVITTAELARTLVHGSRADRRYTVDVAAPLDGARNAGLPVDPWVLGYWLGNGHRGASRVTVGGWRGADDRSHVEGMLAAAGEQWSIGNSSRPMATLLTIKGLCQRLRALGVLHDKRIPGAYLAASVAQRRALLAGLLDSDGSSPAAQRGRTAAVEYGSSDEGLARDVAELVRSLGWKVHFAARPTASGRTGYRVTFTAYSGDAPFASPRKAANLPPRPVISPRSSTNAVVAVEPTGLVEPMVCIAVEHPSHSYLAGEHLTPTHNSTLSSGISGVLLLADGEAGAEVYNVAGSTAQAGRVFEDAKRMMLTSRAARARIEPLKEVVRAPRSGGVLRVLSRVAETAHGLNVSGAVIDEVHTLRLRRALVEAIETGVGARDQPLILFITTADEAEDGTIYDEKHSYAINVSNDVVVDPSFFGVIWGAADDEDPFSEETLRLANPGAGKSPTWRYLRGEVKKAQSSPTYLPTYLRLTLNRRTRDRARFLDIDRWNDVELPLDRGSMRGRRAWGGLDLSAVSDFTAWAVWVESTRPGRELEPLDLLVRLWVPGERVEDLTRQLLVPLPDWIAKGFVEVTEGDAIDYRTIRSAVVGDCKHLDMQRVSYDRMFAGQLVQELEKDLDGGVELVPVAQTFLGLSPATKELQRLVLTKSVRVQENPALRWMASVTEVRTDGADNIRPIKPNRLKATSRIDAIQAAITAMDGIVRHPRAVDSTMHMFRGG